MTPRRLLPIVSIVAIGLTVIAEAAPLPINGEWTILESPDIVGSPYVFGGGPWEVNTATPLILTVTDLYKAGDMFEVWNNGSLLDATSAVSGLDLFADTPDEALGNAAFSQRSFILQPGIYSLLFKSTKFAPNETNTQLAFKAQRHALPEGGPTVLLLGMALAGIVGIRSNLRSMSHS